MLTENQIQQFQQNGFLKGRRVLNDDLLEQLRADLERVIRDQGTDQPQPVLLRNIAKDDAPVWQIVNIWEASEAFQALVYHPVIVEEIAQLLGESEVRLWHDQIQYKPASKGGVNFWHQDSPYWPPLTPKDRQVTAWVALDDVAEDNGCMRMVPASHQWGVQLDFLGSLRPGGFDSMPDTFAGRTITTQSCPVPVGEVHYHHALTWHGSGPNVSSRPRRAVALHYMAGSTVFVKEANHPMVPFIEVAEGSKIEGAHFPLVWQDGPVAAPLAARELVTS